MIPMLDTVLNAITILAWAGFALLVAYLAFRAFQTGGMRDAMQVLVTRRVVLAFLLALTLTLVSASLVFVEPQEVGVVISLTNRDGYRPQPMRSGLHWIVPLAERVVRYPIAWQTYTMSTEPLEGAKPGDDSIAARTSDGQAVYLDSSVIFKIDPNEAIRIHIDFQNRYMNDFIRPIIRGIVRTEVSQFTADEVNSSKRKNLEATLEEELRTAFVEKGFILDRFLLRNIGFSDEYASAIEEKQVAEQERTRREFQAEQIRKLAEGQRDKTKLEAQGVADAAILKGQAEAQVILLKAQAEAQALRLINEILEKNPNLITFRYVDKIGPGVKVMLLPSNNPFLLNLSDLGLTDGGTISTTLEILAPSNEITTNITDTIPVDVLATPTPTPIAQP
jgi:regulator of protease activity HflC (stomatin/prohibitin superfamily)